MTLAKSLTGCVSSAAAAAAPPPRAARQDEPASSRRRRRDPRRAAHRLVNCAATRQVDGAPAARRRRTAGNSARGSLPHRGCRSSASMSPTTRRQSRRRARRALGQRVGVSRRRPSSRATCRAARETPAPTRAPARPPPRAARRLDEAFAQVNQMALDLDLAGAAQSLVDGDAVERVAPNRRACVREDDLAVLDRERVERSGELGRGRTSGVAIRRATAARRAHARSEIVEVSD